MARVWTEIEGKALTLATIAREAHITEATVLKRFRRGWRGYWLTVRRLDSRYIGVSTIQAAWLNAPRNAPTVECSYVGRCNSNKCPLHRLTPHESDRQAWEDERRG